MCNVSPFQRKSSNIPDNLQMIINIHFSDLRTPKYNNVGSTFFHFQSNNEEKRMCGESLNREKPRQACC